MKRPTVAAFAVAAIVALMPIVSLSQNTTQLTVAFYKENKRDPVKAGRQVYFMLGLAEGFMASNSALRLKQQPLLYCQPGRLGLNEALLELVDDNYLGR